MHGGPAPSRSQQAGVCYPAQVGEFAPLRLGELSVWPPVVLAPMAGVTNYPFRSLCREYGAGLYVSEMITARGWLLGNRTTRLLAAPRPQERPRSLQIYGSDPKDLSEMVRGLVAEGIDHIDMNFGCPVPKVTRAGGGAALALKPRLVARLVRAMVGAAGRVPITIKMRKGIDEQWLSFRAAGLAAEAEGVAAVGLHARTAAQLYSGAADWQAIGELKSLLSVPVLGNGDIWECWDALQMMRSTGCDAVIIGRGCLGRPWLFRELAQVFSGMEPAAPPCLGEIVRVMLDHATRLCATFGERHGILQFRKWTSWYTKGFRGSAEVRGTLSKIQTQADLEQVLGTLDPSEAFPVSALRVSRAKGSRRQTVRLPQGYLDTLDDDRAAHEASALEGELDWASESSGG